MLRDPSEYIEPDPEHKLGELATSVKYSFISHIYIIKYITTYKRLPTYG
jgi:hypothetical protein